MTPSLDLDWVVVSIVLCGARCVLSYTTRLELGLGLMTGSRVLRTCTSSICLPTCSESSKLDNTQEEGAGLIISAIRRFLDDQKPQSTSLDRPSPRPLRSCVQARERVIDFCQRKESSGSPWACHDGCAYSKENAPPDIKSAGSIRDGERDQNRSPSCAIRVLMRPASKTELDFGIS